MGNLLSRAVEKRRMFKKNVKNTRFPTRIYDAWCLAEEWFCCHDNKSAVLTLSKRKPASRERKIVVEQQKTTILLMTGSEKEISSANREVESFDS